jgi:hypothetical protein
VDEGMHWLFHRQEIPWGITERLLWDIAFHREEIPKGIIRVVIGIAF